MKTGSALIAALCCSSFGLAAPLVIPDTPLFLRSLGVDPNLIMTIDDSASMMSAFLPDNWRVYPALGCSPSCVDVTYGGTTFGIRYAATNRYKSAAFNAMYYNPFVAYGIPTRPDGVTYSTSFGAAKKNGFLASSVTLDLNSKYRAQIGYTRDGGADWTTDTSDAPAYYYRYCGDTDHPLSCPGTCNGTKDDDDCYIGFNVSATSGPSSAIGADERQNFANWYSFYRTRSLATVSAAMRAMGQVKLDELRFGWQTLNCSESGANCCNTLAASGSYNCVARNDGVNTYDNRIHNYTSAERTQFLNWLQNTAPPAPSTDTGTPLRTALIRAGEYFKTSGINSPYAEDPQTSAGVQYSCRRNFHLLMTDGIWNDTAISSAGNFDGTSATMPDGTGYTARPPFKDGQSDTLADIAAAYWGSDLRDGGSSDNVLKTCTGPTCNTLLPREVDMATPAALTTEAQKKDYIYWNPKNDPATWQHMTTFTVSLGLGSLMTNPAWGGSTFAGDYSALLKGTKNWPSLDFATDDPNKVYDLWHAAIDSRGKFFSADDPDTLTAAFNEILDTISAVSSVSGGAGLSASSKSLSTTTLIFEAKNRADWSGQLQARSVNLTDFTLGAVVWDASLLIPTNPERVIYTINDSKTAVALTSASCAGDLNTALQASPTGYTDDGHWCERRVNWLRGDGKVTNAVCTGGALQVTVAKHGFLDGDEVTLSGIVTGTTESARYNGSFTVASAATDSFTVSVPTGCETPTYASGGRARYTAFRDRQTSVLGDILGSDPVYVSNDDQGYGCGSSAVSGSAVYDTYVAGKVTSAKPPMLYAGANDGMLHGVRADTDKLASGVEQFAYVPRGVYANLSALTDPGYAHKFYVDGPVEVGDAYLGSSWKTYLVGGLGAGGKSIYALDITDASTFTSAQVKWEVSDANDLGLTYSKPQIAPSSASQWDVLLGNGYNSTKENAYLFVIDLENGKPITKVATNAQTSNGLSMPYLHDSNGDKIPDVAYAGDLRGNLWKFVNTAGTWKLGNSGAALFSATNAAGQEQPITSQPKVANHPDGGVLVYFGTGRYLTDADNTNHDQQSFYAIWDKADGPTLTRANLKDHSVDSKTTFAGYSVRTTSKGAPDWTKQRGWYLDLPLDGVKPSERVLSTPLVMEFDSTNVPDRILFVTNTPTSDPCANGGTTWLMELDLITGAPTATSVFDFKGGSGSTGDYVFDEKDLIDTNGDGVGDLATSGVALDTEIGMTGEPLVLDATNPVDGSTVLAKEFSGSTGEKSGPAGAPHQQGGGGGSIQRIYWRQIQ